MHMATPSAVLLADLGNYVPPGGFTDPVLAARHQAFVEHLCRQAAQEAVSLSTPPSPAPEQAKRGKAEPPKQSKAEQARINGAKSKGPVAEAGKAASSNNALKHGMYARGLLVPGEDPAEFQAFARDFFDDLLPIGKLQETLVHRAAELAWKLRRVPAMETAILNSALDRQQRAAREEEGEGFEQPRNDGGVGGLMYQLIGQETDGIFMRLQRYEVRLERSFQGCLRELRLAKKDQAEAAKAVSGQAVGSFHSDAEKGSREAAVVSQEPAAARGPSAARQDDVFAGVRLGSGSFRADTVGSFRTGAVDSFRADAVGSFRADAAEPIDAKAVGSFRPNTTTTSSTEARS